MRTPAYTARMERRSWVRHITVLQFALMVTILALVMMHTPAVSHAMPTSHGAQTTMGANHMNGSACRTIHEQAVAAPVAAEQMKRSPVASADRPAPLNNHSFQPLDQATLGIWRT